MNFFSHTNHRSLILVLLSLSVVFFMFGNGRLSLTHPDEVFYAQTAKEMLRHNSWMTPYIFDKPQFEKPIFFYWLLAVGMKWFGATPFVARFWPAAFGTLGVVIVYWISWMLFGHKRLSFLAGLILSTSFIYVGMSRAVLTDMVFSVWVILALAFFYWGHSQEKRKSWGIILLFVSSALAVLTKGLLGVCFPFSIILLYLGHKKNFNFLNCWATGFGIFLFMLIVVPWHLLMYKLYGQAFIQEYFYNVHIRRLLEAEHLRCDRWYFYPMVLAGGMMPWTFFLLPALFATARRIRERTNNHRGQIFFLLFWVLGILIFPQAAKSKLASYILPAFPALAIILAYYLNDAFEQNQNKKYFFRSGLCWGGYGLAGAIAAAAAASIFFAKRYSAMIPDLFPVYLLAGLLGVLALAMVGFLQRKEGRGVAAGPVGVIVSLFVVLPFCYQFIEPLVSCKEISEVLNRVDSSNSTVLASKFYVRGVCFYTDRKTAVIDIAGKKFFSEHPIPFLDNDKLVLNLLERQPVTFGIFKKENLKDLERIVKQGNFRITTVYQSADKSLVKIEKIISPVI